MDRILIQLLCEVEPSVIADNFNEIIAGKSKNADSYVAVMWALIQPVGKLGKRLEGIDFVFRLRILTTMKNKNPSRLPKTSNWNRYTQLSVQLERDTEKTVRLEVVTNILPLGC